MKTFVFPGDNDEFYFHVLADNGEIIAQSEGYKDMRDATHAAGLIRKGVQPDCIRALEDEGYAVIPPRATADRAREDYLARKICETAARVADGADNHQKAEWDRLGVTDRSLYRTIARTTLASLDRYEGSEQ